MSLLRKLKESNKRHDGFDEPDIYDNNYIVGIDLEKRKKNDGNIMDTLFWLTIGQIDLQTGEKIKEQDFPFWPRKHDSGGKSFSFYVSITVTSLFELLECFYPIEQLEKSFDPFAHFGLNEENFENEVKKVLGVKKNMDAFNEKVKELFLAHISNVVGNPDYRFRIKIVPSNDGKKLELADSEWVESMAIKKEDSKIKLTSKDQQLIIKRKEALSGNPAILANAAPYSPMPMPGMNIPGVTMPVNMNSGTAPAPQNIPQPTSPNVPGQQMGSINPLLNQAVGTPIVKTPPANDTATADSTGKQEEAIQGGQNGIPNFGTAPQIGSAPEVGTIPPVGNGLPPVVPGTDTDTPF